MDEKSSLIIEEINTGISILYDSLVQKQQLLEQILNITENQEQVLKNIDESSEFKELFHEMNRQKQLLIDEVLNLDNVFQNTYEKYSEIMLNRPEHFTKGIKLLQELIQSVMDMDIKIRCREQNNKQLIPKPAKPIPIVNKNYLLKQYQKHNKKHPADSHHDTVDI